MSDDTLSARGRAASRRAAAERANRRPADRRVDPLLRRALLAVVPLGLPPANDAVGITGAACSCLAPLSRAAVHRRLRRRMHARPRAAAAACASCASSLAGLLVFFPFPVLVRVYVLPGLLSRGARPACRRPSSRASRSRGVRAAGSSAAPTSSTQSAGWRRSPSSSSSPVGARAPARRGRRERRVVLADLVLSPLLFIGAALLYVDQAARVEDRFNRGGMCRSTFFSRGSRSRA